MTEAGFVPEDGEDEGDDMEDDSEEKGIIGAPDTPKIEAAKVSVPKTKLEQLNQQLDEAIKKEDYEKAASIRDEIQKLK
jgi:protein-arginine kinase activator protein McsA